MKSIPAVAALIAASTLLTGCTVPAAHRPAASHAVSSASSNPSQTSFPTSTALTSNAIIRITATVTAGTGQVAKLVETVLAPAPADGSEDAAMSNAGCDGSDWQTQYPHPSWTHVSVTATLLSGSSWPSEDTILSYSGSSEGYSAWSGAWSFFQAKCSDGIQTVPGASAGIVPADPSAAALSAASATGGAFGFVYASDTDDPSDMHFTFTDCTIESGPAAGASAPHFTRAPAAGGFPEMCNTPAP